MLNFSSHSLQSVLFSLLFWCNWIVCWFASMRYCENMNFCLWSGALMFWKGCFDRVERLIFKLWPFLIWLLHCLQLKCCLFNGLKFHFQCKDVSIMFSSQIISANIFLFMYNLAFRALLPSSSSSNSDGVKSSDDCIRPRSYRFFSNWYWLVEIGFSFQGSAIFVVDA